MPKRAAPLAEISGNEVPASTPHDPKKPKTTDEPSTTRSGVKFKSLTLQLSNARTQSPQLSSPPATLIVGWTSPSGPDKPSRGECWNPYFERASDLGFPLSEEAFDIERDEITLEIEKRDQDLRELFICSSWNGWGVSEVMGNFLGVFDGVVSAEREGKIEGAVRKWMYVEALASFLKDEWGSGAFMDTDDSDTLKVIIDMFGVMTLTVLATLSEHNLLTPNSDIKNIPIVCLILLEFLQGPAEDLDVAWGCEIVRICDEHGIVLEDSVRKQVAVSNEDLGELRKRYQEKRGRSEIAKDGDGYAFFAAKEYWKVDDDVGDEGRLWYRWDWNLEYPLFRHNHIVGDGSQHDLTKWSEAKLKKYSRFTKRG